MQPLRITILGLSITSSWGNGHATTFRSLVKGLAARGHSVLFLERDVPWYASNRDMPAPPFGRTELYGSLEELETNYAGELDASDLVVVGSYVPDGVAVGEWACGRGGRVTAFYDIDTPVTMARLREGACEYLTPELAGRYDLYLSFTGGPTLREIEQTYGSPLACPLYCSVDPDLYFPQDREAVYDLGYLGTYSPDRQPPLRTMLIDAAEAWPGGRFAVFGPQYPADIAWPANVRRLDHLPPAEHNAFYNEQRFTLNVTRADMVRAGHSPSVRLFEAAACGTPIVSDWWPGLDALFRPDREILISRSREDTLRFLRDLSDDERRRIGRAARAVVLDRHTSVRRAEQLEQFFEQAVRKTRRGAAAL